MSEDLDKRRERCLMCNPQDALDSRTVAMFAANEAANRYKADADRLAEALEELLADPTFAHHQAAKDALRLHSAHTITHTDLPNGTRVIEVAEND